MVGGCSDYVPMRNRIIRNGRAPVIAHAPVSHGIL